MVFVPPETLGTRWLPRGDGRSRRRSQPVRTTLGGPRRAAQGEIPQFGPRSREAAAGVRPGPSPEGLRGDRRPWLRVGAGVASGTGRRGMRPRPRRGATAALAVLVVSLAVAAPAF